MNVSENESALFLGHSRLESMPDLAEINKKTIHLENNTIRVIYSEYLPQVCETLHASFNRIHSDGLPFSWPPNLKNLFLAYNYIQDTDGIAWPEGLKTLDLMNNPLQVWPEDLPDTLERLFLSKTDIADVEPLPRNLKLFLANTARIRQLPTVLPDSLEVLFANSNFLRSSRLPQHWGNGLKQLSLSRNHLKQFPTDLPDSLEVLILENNEISEVPKGLPTSLRILFLKGNKICKVAVEKRKTAIQLVDLTDNELVESISDYQEKNKISWGKFITESQNWNDLKHQEAARRIRKIWRCYRLRRRLRTWRKTSIVKEELQQTSMHPCRAGQFENISTEWAWGWGC